MPPDRPPSSPAAVLRNNVVAGIMVLLLWTAVSLDDNREQENFNRGGMAITGLLLFVYVLIGRHVLHRDPLSPAAGRFLRYGGAGAIVAALLLYVLCASLWLKRVL